MSEQKLQNFQLIINQIPKGVPDKDTFKLQDAPITPPADGEVLIALKYVSVDPYLRNVLNRSKVGTSLVSGVVGEIIESKNETFHVGDFVQFYGPWQKFVTVKPDPSMRKIDPKVAPISTALGVLGMPGQTAYFGLLDVGKAKAGETVLVSGAAGAVGMVVGQIAKIIGCRVIGTAGGAEKCKLIKEQYGFDETIDYKEHSTTESMKAALSAAAPKGIDVYFDNTGGHVTDATMDLLNQFGRVVICGQISMYNDAVPPLVPAFLHKLIYKSITVRGFVVTEFLPRLAEFFRDVVPWVAQGKVKYQETITEGFEKIPEAFTGLFTGANTGKALIKV